MKLRLLVLNFFISIFSFTSVYAATWQLTISPVRKLPKDSGTYQHITANRYKHFPIDVDMILLKKNHYQARLLSQNWSDAKTLAQVSDEQGAMVAINGGFYREQFKPNGLLMLDGRKYARFVSNDLLSAIININKQGELAIYAKKAYHDAKLYSAFQAGPLLYDQNKENVVYGNKLRQRSILVIFNNGDIGIFYFSPVSISDVISVLNQVAQKIDQVIKSATNLDGGVASSFVVNFKHDPIIRLESQPVKMVLLFFNQ
ncbi:phosphodiester glycosidase family protein [Thiotrichales bacterium 19X7-9]|nr:phosphodiester glycosidase family protein [Thiotrichales bacterium 19X7-9]